MGKAMDLLSIAKIAAAQSGGDPVNITHVAVGDALETPYTPTGSKKD